MIPELSVHRQSAGSALVAKLSIVATVISIVALISLHFLSPEFGPSWRMVSEYANGKFEWVLFTFFTFWGIGVWCIAVILWSRVTSIPAKVGVMLLFVSGLGEILAAFFNVNHPHHGTAGTLGIPTFVIASLLISYHLRNKSEWRENKGTLIWSAHAPWISVVLLILTMLVMIAGFKNAGIELGPGRKPPSAVPDGVVAIVGYANRILICAFMFWGIVIARRYSNAFEISRPGN
jgi:hypothetical protein